MNNSHPKADKQRMYDDVKFLTGITPARNYRNLESLDKAAEYIYKEFEKLGLSPWYQCYKADGREYKNVVASYNKHKKEKLVIGAHYDVAGDQPGADDNASGIAGLLETARMLAGHKPRLDYGIELVAYCLEEPPHFTTEYMGSAIHAKYLSDNKVKVRAMLCYEMIGYFSDKPNSQDFPDETYRGRYPDTGNFVIIVGCDGQEEFTRQVQKLMKDASAIDVQAINLPVQHPLAGLSDHRNYWKHGYKAVMIDDTSFLRNPHYHEKSDTIGTLDFDKMAEVVTGAYNVAVNL